MLSSQLRKLSGKSQSDIRLRVQVFQGPAMQCEAQVRMDKPARIRIGRSEKIELPLPFSGFAHDIVLFSITKWGAFVHLDPRIDGFVSDGQRFGDVRDFIAPRGALKELASVLEPLEVPIPVGSRGVLQIFGYSVVFKVERIRPAPLRPKIKGAPKAPFAPPPVNSLIEKTGFVFGSIATAAIVFPLIYWLNKAQFSQFRSVKDTPVRMATHIIHADHFQIMPWVFGQDFLQSAIVPQAVQWVQELRNKWAAEEQGQVYSSSLRPLSGFSQPINSLVRKNNWQSELDDNWSVVLRQNETATPGTFVKGQTAYVPFRVVVSGGENGSISERIRSRLAKLERTHAAVVGLIEAEHGYLKEHFSGMNAAIAQIFDPPKEEGIFFRLAEKEFSLERERFHAAEGIAALARANREEKAEKSGSVAQERALVWVPNSLAVPHVLSLAENSYLTGSEVALLKNAQLSLGMIPPPPAPKPVPKIDMTQVEVFVKGRTAEVKSCYDSALLRDPKTGGSVIWQWTISEKGSVVRSKISKSSIKDKEFLGCLRKKISSWRFPKPEHGAVTISFPFKFVVRENFDTLERMAR